MLSAAITGLILPAVEQTGLRGIWQVVLGVLAGAVFLNAMDKLVPHLHHLSGLDKEVHEHNGSVDKVLLFVLAIAIHNLPEGMAAGVSFGGEDAGPRAVGRGRYYGAEYPRGHGRHLAHAACGHQPPAHLVHCNVYGAY